MPETPTPEAVRAAEAMCSDDDDMVIFGKFSVNTFAPHPDAVLAIARVIDRVTRLPELRALERAAREHVQNCECEGKGKMRNPISGDIVECPCCDHALRAALEKLPTTKDNKLS